MSFDVNAIKSNYEAQAANASAATSTNVDAIKTTTEEIGEDKILIFGDKGIEGKASCKFSPDDIKAIEKIFQNPDLTKPDLIQMPPKDSEDPASKLSEVDKAYITVMVDGDKELGEIKSDLKSSLEKAGYSEEEVEAKLNEAEAKFLEENPEYKESKEKYGDIKGDHDNYIKEQMDEWQKEHPAPDLATATKKELDDYQAEVMKFRSELDAQYGKEHPEYAYYKQQSAPKNDIPNFQSIGDLILPDKPQGADGSEIVVSKPRERIISFRNYNSDPMSKYYL